MTKLKKPTHSRTATLCAAISVAVMLSSSPANARLLIEYASGDVVVPIASPVEPAAQTSRTDVPRKMVYASLVERGNAPESMSVVSINVVNEKLLPSIARIVPPDWRAYSKLSKGSLASTATFKGDGRQWMVVLDEILQDKGIAALVDWKKSEITFVKTVKKARELK